MRQPGTENNPVGCQATTPIATPMRNVQSLRLRPFANATRLRTADLLAKQRAAEEIQWLSITSCVRLWNLPSLPVTAGLGLAPPPRGLETPRWAGFQVYYRMRERRARYHGAGLGRVHARRVSRSRSGNEPLHADQTGASLAIPHQHVYRGHRRQLREPEQMRLAAAIRTSKPCQRDHRAGQPADGGGCFMLASRTATRLPVVWAGAGSRCANGGVRSGVNGAEYARAILQDQTRCRCTSRNRAEGRACRGGRWVWCASWSGGRGCRCRVRPGA